MTMIAGTRLGPYEIREPLGAGGMGEVYLAHDTRLGRQVAVKVLPESFAGDASRLERFAQEARAAAALNHPHIAAVFDVGEERGTHYMVQELLEGKTLREVMGGPMAVTRAIPLATEIAEALAAAHKAGIVHRDLKPDNIFVAEDGHAKVLDFGLAKLTESGGAPGTEASMSPTMLGTEAGEVMGTAGYMAPEQAQGAEVDHRADLFALGCVLYEMITGRGPFAGKNVYDTLGKIVSDDPAPIDSHVPGTPLELQRIVRKCLSKQPELRYQNAADAAVDLRLLLREIEAGTAVSEETLSPVSEAAATGRLSPLLVAGMLIVAVVAAVFATDALQPEPAPAPLRTFDFAFPEDHPAQLPCCSSALAIARDASYLAFFAATEGGTPGDGWGLYVRPFNSLSARRIGDVNGYIPSVSPDGEWIAYLALGEGSRDLMKIALAGGAPFELVSDSFAQIFWADDGYIYFGARSDAGFRRVPENGGEVERLEVTGLPEDVVTLRVWVLAQESLALLDLAKGRMSDEGGIAVVDLDTLAATMLVEEGSDPRWTASGHVLWTRAGVVYAAPFDTASRQLAGRAVPVLQGVAVDISGAAQMAVAEDGTLAWVPGEGASPFDAPARLEWLDAEGNTAPVAGSERNYWAARLSPDETRIAVRVRDTEEGQSDVWLLDIAQDALTRLTSAGGTSPVWSPEGDWVYFNTRAGGDWDIWRRRSDFSAPAEPVLGREGDQYVESIAPDGLSLVYQESVEVPEREDDSDWQGDLWLLPLDGGETMPLVESPDYEYDAEFSPDGRLLAYTSDESGVNQLYVRELDGQRRWTVSPGDGYRPRWSRDGRQLFYAGSGSLFVVGVDFDGDYRQSTPRQLEVPDNRAVPWDIAADGRVLAIARDDPFGGGSGERARVNITLNWFQELERLAPHGQ